MSSRNAARKRRSAAYYAPGVKGRATGIELRTGNSRDQDGLANLDDFYNDSDSDEGSDDEFGEDDNDDGESQSSDDQGNQNDDDGLPEAVPAPRTAPRTKNAKASTARKSTARSSRTASKKPMVTPTQPTPIKRLSFAQGSETPEFSSVDIPADQDDAVPETPAAAGESPEFRSTKSTARKTTPKSSRGSRKHSDDTKENVAKDILSRKAKKSVKEAQPRRKKNNSKRSEDEMSTENSAPEFIPLDGSNNLDESQAVLDGVRRSSRNRLTPCAYWKNERVVYENVYDDVGVVRKAKGKIKPKTPEVASRGSRKRRKTTKPAASRKKRLARVDEEGDEEDDDADADADESVTLPSNGVYEVVDWTAADADEDESLVAIALAKTQAMLTYTNVKNSPALSVSKTFSARDMPWASGMLKVGPNSEKPRQSTKTNFLFFYVVSSSVRVTIHLQDGESVIPLGKGSMFFVPPGNVYSMVNETTREASLVFVQIKVPPPQPEA